MHSKPVHLFGQSLVRVMLVVVRWLEIIFFLRFANHRRSIDWTSARRSKASIAGVSGSNRYHSIKTIQCEVYTFRIKHFRGANRSWIMHETREGIIGERSNCGRSSFVT